MLGCPLCVVFEALFQIRRSAMTVGSSAMEACGGGGGEVSAVGWNNRTSLGWPAGISTAVRRVTTCGLAA